MFDARSALRLVLAAAALAGVLSLAPSAQAQQSFQRFIPFLIDLPGWTGRKPDGMAMQVPGNSMITATRQYRRGRARLNAQIVIGPAALGMLAAGASKLKIETTDARLGSETIDGLRVTRTYNLRKKSGAVLVALGTSSLFNLAFDGISDDEGLKLAKAFDWKAMQAAVPK